MKALWKSAAAGNYKVGRAARISRITFHHIAGDAAGAIARFQSPGVEVSATYVIGSNGSLYQCVDESNTSYSDGNADSNARAISIECAGGVASVPYTDAMYATASELVRDLIGRHGITDFKRHRDVIDKVAYPGGTACPGTLDVERIINNAKEEDMPNEGDLINIVRLFGRPDSEAQLLAGAPWKSVYENYIVGRVGELAAGRDTATRIANVRGDELNELGQALGTGDITDEASFNQAISATAKQGVSRESVLAYVTKNLKEESIC